MYYVPKKAPRNAAVISVSLFGGAAALYLVGEFFSPRLFFQLIALILAAVGIYLTSRYILTDYKYVLKDIDGPYQEISFTIVKVNGKREAIMANFELNDVYALEKCRKTSAFEQKHGKVNKVYNYCSNLLSPDVYKLALKFNGMNVLFSVELSEEFAREISVRLPSLPKQNDGEASSEP